MPRLSLRADAGVGAIAVSPNSRDVVLAGRSGLYIVDLHDPFTLPRWLPLRSAWEVANVQWCPHPNRPACLVSSSNQKVLVWNLALPSEKAIEHVLHGHRRAVTDINFSTLNNNMFATSSIDTTVRLWDMRDLNSVTHTFADFGAGMMQCQWDPTNEHRIASAQASRVTIWDKRMANSPYISFKAHNSECNGLEYFGNGHIITCSTDRTIKVWDLKHNDSKPRLQIETDFPLWRAFPSPFEYGAFLVPLRGGKNHVSLVNFAGMEGTHQFSDVQIGYYDHPSKVKSAVYMRTDQSSSGYDLMTWCNDLHLREWRGDMLLQLPHASIGTRCKDEPVPKIPSAASYNTDEFDRKFHDLHDAGREMFDLPLLNRKNQDSSHALSQYDWIAGVHMSKMGISQVRNSNGSSEETEANVDKDFIDMRLVEDQDASKSSQIFSQEIISVSTRLPRVLFEDINIGRRTCVLTLLGPWGKDGDIINLRIGLHAPLRYPAEPLRCDVSENNPDITSDNYNEVSRFLYTASKTFSEHNLQSLEFCVRYLVGDPVSIEDYISKGENEQTSMTELPQELMMSGRSCPVGAEQGKGQSGNAGVSDGNLVTTEGNNDNSEDDMFLSEEDGVITANRRRLGMTPMRPGTFFSSEADYSMTHSIEPDSGSDSGSDDDDSDRVEAKENIIDSTPLPKSCGGVWSVTGQLICFFNHKPVKKDRGPLPLDKVFADGDDSDDSDAPFLSDSDDFENIYVTNASNALLQNSNWAITAGQLNGTVLSSGHYSSSDSQQHPLRRSRTRTITTVNSEDGEPLSVATTTINTPHTVVIHDLLNLWPCRPDLAAEYEFTRLLSPLEMSRHNLEVAQKYDLPIHVNVWKMLIEYILSEYESFSDPLYGLAIPQYRFEWSGDVVGFASFLPSLTSFLEQQGEFQLLVGMSMVFSSLRAKREILKRESLMRVNPDLRMLPTMESDVETYFYASNNNVMMLEKPNVAAGGNNLTIAKPHEQHSYLESVYGSFLRNNNSASSSTLASMKTQNTRPTRPVIQQRSTTSVFNTMAHFMDQHTEMHGHDNTSNVIPNPSNCTAENGLFFSFEISDSVLFEFPYPQSPSAIYARPRSDAVEQFNIWLPRLTEYRVYYASLLHTWGLYMQRAEVSKPNYMDPLVAGAKKRMPTFMKRKSDVHLKATSCAFCHQPITKMFEFCGFCCHAMHSNCALLWWQDDQECPAACGCLCKNDD